MTTLKSFLKSLFPFKGYKLYVLDCETDVVIDLESRRKTGTCPKCGKQCTNIEDEHERRIRDLDLAELKCYLCFNAVIKTMQNYMYGILNYFRYGMTNAIAEGFNTKINVIKRRAFGYRDIEYFILKIYQNSLKRLA